MTARSDQELIDLQSLLPGRITDALVVPGQDDRIVHWCKGAELTFGFSELEDMGSPPSLPFGLSNADCEHGARAMALGGDAMKPFAGARTANSFVA